MTGNAARSPATTGPVVLDDAGLATAVRDLTARDVDLAGIVARHGPPPLWAREPGFETLVKIILEQQVSLASGEAALGRLIATAGAVNPSAVAAAGEERLRAAGLTRQKARYLVALANDILDGRVDLAAIGDTPNEMAHASLTSLLGIGRWTADIYLLMALRRPDIWPTGDLALATAMRRAKGLAEIPSAADQVVIAEPWQPWRAVAARILWHAYLAGER